MNNNIIRHYRAMWLQLGNIYDGDPTEDPIEHGEMGRIIMLVAKHLDACGVKCAVPKDSAGKKAVEEGIPLGCSKKGGG